MTVPFGFHETNLAPWEQDHATPVTGEELHDLLDHAFYAPDKDTWEERWDDVRLLGGFTHAEIAVMQSEELAYKHEQWDEP